MTKPLSLKPQLLQLSNALPTGSVSGVSASLALDPGEERRSRAMLICSSSSSRRWDILVWPASSGSFPKRFSVPLTSSRLVRSPLTSASGCSEKVSFSMEVVSYESVYIL
jgi:hypothetical protein